MSKDVLHLYGQSQWHFPAEIIGNREGLIKLRDAIDLALRQGKAEFPAMASDGEGYDLTVTRFDHPFGSTAWKEHPPDYNITYELQEYARGLEDGKKARA